MNFSYSKSMANSIAFYKVVSSSTILIFLKSGSLLVNSLQEIAKYLFMAFDVLHSPRFLCVIVGSPCVPLKKSYDPCEYQ